MQTKNRPLSPHLQVYKLPLTGLISIGHRIAGVCLAIGLLVFVSILFAIAGGYESFTQMQALLNWPLFKLIYWGFVYALFFHLAHGIRHLFWDAGIGFELQSMNLVALVELSLSLLLTILVLW